MLSTKTIIYAVDHSYPFSSDGYSVRTSAIAEALAALGHRVIVVNRPGRLWSRKNFDASGVRTEYRHRGVQYLYFQDTDFPYSEIYAVYKPYMVLAASNHANAIPALTAARKASIDCVYEVRGFWELTRAFKDKKYATSDTFEADKKAEADAANLADEVWTLNAIMRDELITRGVSESHIKLLPNSLTQLPKISAKTGLLHELAGSDPNRLTIAYVGSFNRYEGLELLIGAVAAFNREVGVHKIQLVLVGSGATQGVDGGDDPVTEELKRYTERAGIADSVFFPGRLSSDVIAKAYADIDLVVNPRLASPVTNIVSSLKAIEAMAYAKPLVLSDIPPHQLLNDEVPDGVTLFKAESVDDLVERLKKAVEQLPALNTKAAQQRNWISDNRLFSSSDILQGISTYPK